MIGSVVGNYELKSVLGEGAMGTVYLAEHPYMGRRAAVKVLRRSLASDQLHVQRFMNEARAANAIRHPNIIDIIDVGFLFEGVPYLMMEFLEGESLGSRLRGQGRLNLEQALDITRQMAEGLAAAHESGIVHRDLKPDNVFLVREPGLPQRERVKLLDFGIAKLMDRDLDRGLATKSGVLLGTPLYMSPEQCRGIASEVDHRTDIYALAVILYQMLSGKLPFDAPGTGDILMMHVSQEPPPLRQEVPEVPAHVAAAIARGLAKSREQRFQSMYELAAALGPLPPETRQVPADTVAPLRASVSLPALVAAAAPPVSTRRLRLDRRTLSGATLAVVACAALLLLPRQSLREPGAVPGAAGPARTVNVPRAPAVDPGGLAPEPAPVHASLPASGLAPEPPLPQAAPAPDAAPAPAAGVPAQAPAPAARPVRRRRAEAAVGAATTRKPATRPNPGRRTELW
jgi:eukaryotic-like serine/threonine-protein kinase